MNYNKPKLREMLAAEYALGTLHGAARRRFERLLARDAHYRASVQEWQQRLAPLDYVVPAVPPPERVWQGIARRITAPAPQPQRAATRKHGLWDSLGFWRALALATSTVAAALLIYFGSAPVAPPAPNYVVVLLDAKAKPAIALNYAAGGNELVVSIVAAQELTPQQALELWALPQGGAPQSLGLLPVTGKAAVKLTRGDVSLDAVPAFAVSLEPKGGSPTGAPTGPVLYSGAPVKL
jgi:anti-sigma-K factor RskA